MNTAFYAFVSVYFEVYQCVVCVSVSVHVLGVLGCAWECFCDYNLGLGVHACSHMCMLSCVYVFLCVYIFVGFGVCVANNLEVLSQP